MKIRAKIMIPMIAIALLTAIAVLGTVTFIFSGYVDDTTEEEIQRAASVMLSEYEWQIEESENTSGILAEDAAVRQAMAAGDRDALLERALWFDERMDVDFITLTDAQGVVLAHSHDAASYGEDIAAQENIRNALEGKSFSALEVSDSVALSVRAGVPVYADGALVGLVSSGYRLDTDVFVEHIKSLTGCEATVFLGDVRLSTTVTDAAGNRVVGTKAAENVSAAVLSGQEYAGKAQVVNREAFVKYLPIANTEGEILGMLFVGKFTDGKWSAVWNFVLQGGLIALVLIVIAIAVTMAITKRIITPIRALVAAGDRLAAGETDVEIAISTKDEIYDLGESFKHIIEGSREQEQVITAMANGDLTVDIHPRGEKDAVALALQKMLAMNNQVFGQIYMTAEQVANASNQLAGGSQNLAQGSTEQAGVVQELSASITDVAGKSRENAEVATKAAALSETIRSNAEKGSGQMQDLTAAVNEINEASQAIASVIKIIDDIAFQTNILALNAAVEAARAGEHGKGFAVVADEVRSLAGKSAEAAKNTDVMINSSIEKAEYGASIAADTAVSLNDIVQGINENSKMMSEIASSAAGASEAISQINVGIDQVAQVVQQNSATAEESAAASEEMSSQSQMLRSLVAQFELKNVATEVHGRRRAALPAGEGTFAELEE